MGVAQVETGIRHDPIGMKAAHAVATNENGPVMALTKELAEKAAHAGELLIRAAAVLGTLSEKEQAELAAATGGRLAGGIAMALNAASEVSPAIVESLRSHPPAGFISEFAGLGVRR